VVDDPTLSGIHATMLRLFSGVDQDGIKMGWGCRENLISMVEIRPQKNGIQPFKIQNGGFPNLLMALKQLAK